MIIKKNAETKAFPWRAGVIAGLLALLSIGTFCLTCKHKAQMLGKISSKLNFEAPAVAIAQTLAPALPKVDLVPKITQKMTVLLMGVDSNGINADPFQGTRSDTMMLVSIDPFANKVGVVSIPRDSRVRVPNHGVDKINSAHAFGGAELSRQTVREAFGVPVDHFIEIDTGGLKKLFEILGPVEVLVEKEMHYVDHTAKLNVDLQPGLQQLTPAQAEEYVRFRHDNRGDIGRIERQQWFVRQAARKFKEPQIVLKMPELVGLAYQCVRTDLSVQDMLAIAFYAKDFPQEKVVTAMLPGDARWIGGGSYWVPDAIASQAMFSRILGASTTGLQSLDGTVASGKQDTPAAPQLSSPADNLPSQEPGLSYDYSKPPTVAIKYPRGCEQLSQAIADQLTLAGFKVRYRWQIAAADCQHELLVQQSLRASDEATSKMYQSIPELQNFPLSLALEARPGTDFTLIVSPDSQMPSICHSNIAAPPIQQKAPPLNVSATAIPLLPQE